MEDIKAMLQSMQEQQEKQIHITQEQLRSVVQSMQEQQEQLQRELSEVKPQNMEMKQQ